MAATTGLPTPASTAGAPPVKAMKDLMNEIDQAKKDIEAEAKILEKIDTGRKKALTNRDRSVEGRTKIRELTERVANLRTQMDAMTKESDPTWPAKTFDKTKKNALKTLTSLSSKLEHADKHLERATGTLPSTTTAPLVTNTQSTITPATAPLASTEGEHTKGIGALASTAPLDGRRKLPSSESPTLTTPGKHADETRKHVVASDEEEDEEGEEEDVSDVDDDDVVSARKRESEKPHQIIRKAEPIISDRKKTEPIIVERKKPPVAKEETDESDESDESEDDDDDDGASDHRQLLNQLKSQTLTDESIKEPISSVRRSRSPATPRSAKRVSSVKTDPTQTSSPRLRKTKTLTPPPPPSRKETPSPRRRTDVPVPKKRVVESDEDSYFEDEEDEEYEEEELRGLRDTGDHEHGESDHDYNEPEEEEATVANAHVQELRTKNYSPGTQFIVTHDLNAVQTGDLTVHRGESLTLIEQRPDDWWLFKNNQTQQQGVVPINHVQILSQPKTRRRIKPSTSAITLVDAFKANNSVPAGYIPSDLAPLTQLEEYQLSRAMVPKMTESNLSFADLHWRADTDKLYIQEVTYQKILTIKECVKIPRIKGEQIRVLDRCVRVCLYDGYEIVSNIHTIRAYIPRKIDERDLTEDWHFAPNDINTLTDEQCQLLVRSNKSDSNQHLKLLFELSQWCQSTVTQEKCEIACGWSAIPLDDDKPPLVTDTKGYNELLRGGHIDETNVFLDPKYKDLRSNGLTGTIDRFKRARIKFSIESRETDMDLLYDNLPIQSIIVPINLIKTLAFFRNELAYQIHKRQHPTGLSTTPIDSIFLSTFFQTLEQPDLIYTLRRLYSSRRKRFLTSSSSLQQQREEFIRTYEFFIYPLLHYRQLPPYDFHDITGLNERRKLINDMIKKQIPARKTIPQDILTVLLDPNLTDKWSPFTTDEVSFTLQKYIHDFKTDVVA